MFFLICFYPGGVLHGVCFLTGLLSGWVAVTRCIADMWETDSRLAELWRWCLAASVASWAWRLSRGTGSLAERQRGVRGRRPNGKGSRRLLKPGVKVGNRRATVRW